MVLLVESWLEPTLTSSSLQTSASLCIDFCISTMVTNKRTGFVWKLSVVYGSPYQEGKRAFIDELHSILGAWSGPIIVGGHFNLVRLLSDKNSQIFNFRWGDPLMTWVSKWGLIPQILCTLGPITKRTRSSPK